MRHVILWGLSGDPPFDSVRRELIRRDVPHLAVDQRTIRDVQFDLCADDGLTGRLAVGEQAVDLDEIGAMFVRPYDIRQVLQETSGVPPTADVQRVAMSLEEALFTWADIADALVINRPSAMISNSSKPYQAELIREHGFEIPETLVTTTPDAAREFIAHHGQVIYKSVSDVRSMVTRVDDSDMNVLDDVAHCPTQFQAYVAGTDWRVHVVGAQVFACEIRCDADDYRCAPMQGVALDIRSSMVPEAIAARCYRLAHTLNLPLAGIDLRRTTDDRWYCFEVNPAPAFTYYEQETGQPLSAAVARLLSRRNIDSSRAGSEQPVDFR